MPSPTSKTTGATRKLWPVPEILTEEGVYSLKETTKRESRICTDLVDKIMSVPTTDDAFGRMGRMHEMAHVAITPTDGMQIAVDQGIGADYINVAEDMRVNKFLDRKFTLEASIDEEMFLHTMKGYSLGNDKKAATLMAVACYYTPEYGTLMDFIRNDKYEWYYDIQDVIRECRYMLEENSFRNALDVARYLQGNFNPILKEIEDSEYVPEEILDDLRREARYSSGEDVEWGTMKIERPPLTEHMAQKRLNRRVKPQDMGSTMMFPSRIDVDDKIFGNIKRVSKGTVLIDVSGSMHMEPWDVEEMIKTTPGVTVACYSGNCDGTGHLTIIASKGSMMKIPNHWPGANEVDGPALQWLARQAEPRVWVCDGHVTGCEDRSSPHLTLEAFKIVADNKIRRTPYIHEVTKLLKK